MKVLHINKTSLGGAFNLAYSLHSRLNVKGIESKMLIYDHKVLDSSSLLSFSEINELNLLQKFKNKFFSLRKRYYLRGLPSTPELFSFSDSPFQLEKLDEVKNADLIHLHWISEFVNLRTFFKYVRKPVIWTFHDQYPYSGGFHCSKGFPTVQYRKLLQRNFEIKRKAFAKPNVEAVVVSRNEYNNVNNSCIINPSNLHLIYNTVNFATFKLLSRKETRTELGIHENEKVLLFMADSLDRELKGFKLFLKALANISRVCRVIVVGNSKNFNILPKVLNNIQIEYLGQISNQGLLAKIYNSVNLFINPTLQEAFSLTTLESLACGTPVIAFPVGAIPEMISDGVNGEIVNEKDSALLASAIERNLNTEFNNESISENIVIKFGEDIFVNSYISLYEKALSKL